MTLFNKGGRNLFEFDTLKEYYFQLLFSYAGMGTIISSLDGVDTVFIETLKVTLHLLHCSDSESGHRRKYVNHFG